MNTHILIPISNIELKIQQIKLSTVGGQQLSDIMKGELAILEHLLAEGKQISLDEKDVENKAHEADYNNHDLYRSFKSGYKQALKDLL